MVSNYDNLPDSYKKDQQTQVELSRNNGLEDTISNLSFARGVAAGLAMKCDELERQLAESEQKLQIAMDYQREVDAKIFENEGDRIGALGYPATAKAWHQYALKIRRGYF